VLGVEPGSAADRAGLRPARPTGDGRIVPGDVIVGLDAAEVATVEDLYAALERHAAGDSVEVEVRATEPASASRPSSTPAPDIDGPTA
jgi:S1-C subfamily serine protease